MEFLVEFEITVPDGTSDGEVERRERAEASAAADLAARGRLIRVWKLGASSKTLGLYRAESREQLDALLAALPLADWMRIGVTALLPHPNDPAANDPAANGPGTAVLNDLAAVTDDLGAGVLNDLDAAVTGDSNRLPEPRLSLVYHLDAAVAAPLDLGEIRPGRLAKYQAYWSVSLDRLRNRAESAEPPDRPEP